MSDDVVMRYGEIRAAIENTLKQIGRAPGSVRIIAVSKKKPAEIMQSLHDFGIAKRDPIIFGENYLQEFAGKRVNLTADCECHFVGHLQRNKAKEAVQLFSVIESIDSRALAESVNAAAHKIEKQQEIYLQVNISRDEQKGGFHPEELLAFICDVAPALTNLTITGLMTITAFYEDPEGARSDFGALRELRDSLLEKPAVRHALGRSMLELSMGMSSDYLVAVEEGATVVRIGTAIFGER